MESESSTACILCKDAQHSSANDASGLDDNVLIQCDSCGIWYHIGCVDLQEFEVEDIDRYHCEKCKPNAGPTIYKVFTNTHRNDPCEVDAQDKSVECGTIDFLKILKEKTNFHNAFDVILDLENGHNLDVKYLESTSFDKPILVRHSAGLDLNVPDINSIDDLETWLDDAELSVDVIDSQRQKDYNMKFSTLLVLFRQKTRKRIYNLISMEFSKTKLSPLVILPKIVDDISWVHQYWPKNADKSTQDDFNSTKDSLISQDSGINDVDDDNQRPLASFASEHAGFKPEVSKFCLISMKDSYTDFHIDFGGSSVWYHILWGEKIFYLIEPTESNLMLYDEWMKASNKSERFFGDEVEKCYVQKLSAGHTFFIPTGWIHAVLTPSDSLVFGGNFLQSFNIPLQLKIYDMELGCSMYEKYMFPNFELVNWYAGYNFIELLTELNEEKIPAKRYLEVGIPALIDQMKKWLENKKDSRFFVQKIDSLTFPRLVTKLEKVFKTNQKIRREQREKRALKLSNVVKSKQVHQKPKNDPGHPKNNIDGSLVKLAFRSPTVQRANEKSESDVIAEISALDRPSIEQTVEIPQDEDRKNIEPIPPLKLNLCSESIVASTGDIHKEALSPKDDLKITLSLKSKPNSGQKRKYTRKNEGKSPKKGKSPENPVSEKKSISERLDEDERKNEDLKIEKSLENESVTDSKNIERLHSIFAVSKHGRVPKVNKNIDIDLAVFDDSGNHKEYAYQNNLDDEEDEDFSDEELLRLKSSKLKLGAPYLHLLSKPKKKFHDTNPRKSAEILCKNEDDAQDMKIKKKKQPSTVKQRLAMKLKIK